MNKLLMAFLSFSIVGCSIFSKNEPPPVRPMVSEELADKFEAGNKHLDNKRYQDAIKIYNDVINQVPQSDLARVSRYNLGVAYEAIGDCKKAGTTFREVVRQTKQSEPRIQATALVKLSYAYACVGRQDLVISSLTDAWRRRQYLPEAIGQAEVPARLAAAYAQQGNFEVAEKYFKFAESGFQKLQRMNASTEKKRDLLAQTLFTMGKVANQKPTVNTADQYLAGVGFLQSYLLRSVELDSSKWSAKAAEQIRQAYDQIWLLAQSVPTKANDDPAIAKQQKEQQQNKILRSGLINLERLRAERLPDPNEPKIVGRLFQDLNKHEKKFQSFLASLSVQTPLTPEAIARLGPKIKGRTYQPNPKLEEEAQRRGKKKEKN